MPSIFKMCVPNSRAKKGAQILSEMDRILEFMEQTEPQEQREKKTPQIRIHVDT